MKVRRPGQSRHSRQNRLTQDGTSTVEWIANIIHVECVALLEKSREHTGALKQKGLPPSLEREYGGRLFCRLMTRAVVSTFTTGSYMIEA